MGFSILHWTGIVGMTKKTGALGCICHNIMPTDEIVVWISGPDSVLIGTRYLYTVSIRGGPAVAGGFNVAAGSGTLDIAQDSTYVLDGELTHLAPKLFQGDTLQWRF